MKEGLVGGGEDCRGRTWPPGEGEEVVAVMRRGRREKKYIFEEGSNWLGKQLEMNSGQRLAFFYETREDAEGDI